MRLDETEHAGHVQRARLSANLTSASEGDERRYAANAKARGDSRRVLGVELGQTHARLELRRRLLVRRRHQLARATPGRPEINHQRQIARVDVTVEVCWR